MKPEFLPESYLDDIKKAEGDVGALQVVKGRILVDMMRVAQGKVREREFAVVASLHDLVCSIDRMVAALSPRHEPHHVLSAHDIVPHSVTRTNRAAQSLQENSNSNSNEESNDAVYANTKNFRPEKGTLILFYSERCGYCHEFKPIWAELKRIYAKRGLNVVSVRGDNATPEVTAHIREFGVTGYPTLFFIEPHENRIHEFKEERTLANLIKFVENYVG